jgi:hypothetical protein
LLRSLRSLLQGDAGIVAIGKRQKQLLLSYRICKHVRRAECVGLEDEQTLLLVDNEDPFKRILELRKNLFERRNVFDKLEVSGDHDCVKPAVSDVFTAQQR